MSETARIGIVTVSDRASAGVYADEGGPAIRDYFAKVLTSPWEAVARIIPDDRKLIATVNNLLELGEARRELAQANAGERKRRDALLADYDLRGIVYADPASENALTLPPDVVRALPGFVGAGPNGEL